MIPCHACGTPFTPTYNRRQPRSESKFCSEHCHAEIHSVPLADRFWMHVNKTDPTDCWEWIGLLHKDGTGRIRDGERLLPVDRVVLHLANVPIPDRGMVLHSCNNPRCVNPAHLAVRASDGKRAVARITAEEVLVICQRKAEGEDSHIIARDLGVSLGMVEAIYNSRSLKHLP